MAGTYQSATPCTQNVLVGNDCVVEQSELFKLGHTSEAVACFHLTQEKVFFLNSGTFNSTHIHIQLQYGYRGKCNYKNTGKNMKVIKSRRVGCCRE